MGREPGFSARSAGPVPGSTWRAAFGLTTSGTPDLLSSLAGGIYAYDGERYRQRSDGLIHIGDGQRVLIERCDESFQCTLEWRDQESWEVLDLYVPQYDAFPFALFGSRWLAYNPDFDDPRTALFDIESGREMALEFDGFDRNHFAISLDGRWLATMSPANRFLELTNLETDEMLELDGFSRLRSLVFTERG